MVPSSKELPCGTLAAPRTCGDGPEASHCTVSSSVCSPHVRGWSRLWLQECDHAALSPTRAGMAPGPEPRHREASRVLLPARAGSSCDASMSPLLLRDHPRARGDGPAGSCKRNWRRVCSPGTRGWSRLGVAVEGVQHLLPARAGMVPSATRPCCRCRTAPRTRRDGPHLAARVVSEQRCSPRTWGWPRVSEAARAVCQLLPAHAGMTPTRHMAAPSCWAAPAPAGMGPPSRRAVRATPGATRTREDEKHGSRKRFSYPTP